MFQKVGQVSSCPLWLEAKLTTTLGQAFQGPLETLPESRLLRLLGQRSFQTPHSSLRPHAACLVDEREADLARAQRQDFVLSCRGVPAGALQADPGCKRAQTARLHAGCKLGCRLSSADSPLPHLFPFRSPPTRFPAPCAAPLISPSLRSWWLHPGAAAA